MRVKVMKIIYSRYRYVFDAQKTAKAFGYWQPSKRVEYFFRLAKSATEEDLKSGKVFSAILQTIGISRKNPASKLLRQVCNCSVYCISLKEYEHHYRDLCESLRAFDISDLKNDAIELLIYVLLTLGMFSAALLLREKYENKILTEGFARDKYAVLFQNGKFSEALSLLHSAFFFRSMKFFRPSAYVLMEKCLLPLVCPERADRSSRFARYLSGKSIYIIGPSDNHAPISIQDQNRVVIRYAYMGKDKIGGYYKNIPTDISYYNGAHATTVASMQQTEFLSDLSFAVLKYKLKIGFWDHLAGVTNVRYASRAPYTMQQGVSPNMLQIVLTDLIPFGKLDLTVLDNNFYLNRHYTEGYASNQILKKMDDYAFATQFAKHDVFCNFKFTKALFQQGFFSADERLDEILHMSCEQFALAMEKEYGHQLGLSASGSFSV